MCERTGVGFGGGESSSDVNYSPQHTMINTNHDPLSCVHIRCWLFLLNVNDLSGA